MRQVSFYRDAGRSDNLADMTMPLRVNCCGIAALSHPFTTYAPQGRKDYYFLYMAEGGMDIWIGGEMHVIRAGDFVIFPPGTPYHYALTQGAMAYYWIHFTGAMAQALLKDCLLETNTLYHPGVDDEALDAIRLLHRAFPMRGRCFEQECAGGLTVLLARLSRCIGATQARGGGVSRERIRVSLEHLHSHYDQPLTVGELAALEFLSPSRYGAVFRACVGISPQRYLTELRMRSARELMLTTDMPLGQIASSVGYEDQLYFSRLFRRMTGVSPREYRQHSAAPALGSKS